VTIEDNAVAGGAGSGVAECFAAHGLAPPLLQLGLPDGFLDHGSREELLAQAGLDATSIESAIRARFGSFQPASSLRNVS
jgi:1-deoxy-D-xylulose-5-phosphate synthase